MTADLKKILSFSLLFWAIIASGPGLSYAAGPIVRESRGIIIDGVKERWRLEWSRPPREVCGPDDPDWIICPCAGFAFGQAGELVLVREIPGKKPERFPLGPLFKSYQSFDPPCGEGESVLRRWDVGDSDLDVKDHPGFAGKVRKRPASAVMKFGDYDHDGKASEFLLQIGTLPCGKKMSVVIGISKDRKSLHAFSSEARPDRPLVLQAWQWEKLLSAKETIRTVSWPCGDHGSETETELELNAAGGTISVVHREFQCTPEGKRGKLINEERF